MTGRPITVIGRGWRQPPALSGAAAGRDGSVTHNGSFPKWSASCRRQSTSWSQKGSVPGLGPSPPPELPGGLRGESETTAQAYLASRTPNYISQCGLRVEISENIGQEPQNGISKPKPKFSQPDWRVMAVLTPLWFRSSRPDSDFNPQKSRERPKPVCNGLHPRLQKLS